MGEETAEKLFLGFGCWRKRNFAKVSNDEIKLDDIGNFKITVHEAKDYRQVHLTGLVGNSAMGISDIKTTSHNDELNITLFQKLAGSKYSGKLDKEIALDRDIKKITYGSKHEIIWQE